MRSTGKAWTALSGTLLWVFWAVSSTQAADAAWSRHEAEVKLGIAVQCVDNPNQDLLQWGPNFPGWDRSSQPKALGRPVVAGSTGIIKEILQVSENQYRVVVHWDRDKPEDTYWSTVIGPAEYGRTVFSLAQLELIGRWREIGRSATVEFLKDGGFRAVDNEGMAVAGRYSLINGRSIKFEIPHEETTDEILSLDFTLSGDNLTLTPGNGHGDAEYYRRER